MRCPRIVAARRALATEAGTNHPIGTMWGRVVDVVVGRGSGMLALVAEEATTVDHRFHDELITFFDLFL